jgi:hypothetical protein
MDQAILNDQIERVLDGLGREFAVRFQRTRWPRSAECTFEQLHAEARIDDFIPLLVYRFTREELRKARPAEWRGLTVWLDSYGFD